MFKLICISYKLFSFSFFSGFLRTRLGPDTLPSSGGNLALQDIAMALEWTQENIAAFGGDPSRITLIGHDTGAALANYLLLARYAKGKLILLKTSLFPTPSIYKHTHLSTYANVLWIQSANFLPRIIPKTNISLLLNK